MARTKKQPSAPAKKKTVEVINLKSLKPNPTNPRTITEEKFDALVKSIQDFPEMMFKRPLVCVTDADGLIYPLGGNMRLAALKKLYKEVPAAWVQLVDDWSEEKKKQFVIKDNVGFGQWDWDMLANEWDSKEINSWGLDVWHDQSQNESEELKEPESQTSPLAKNPSSADDDYSVFELVMLYDNKLKLLDELAKVKQEFLFEKQEDALMEIIRQYRKTN